MRCPYAISTMTAVANLDGESPNEKTEPVIHYEKEFGLAGAKFCRNPEGTGVGHATERAFGGSEYRGIEGNPAE